MKKLVLLCAAMTMVVGCSSWRKKSGSETEANPNGSGVISETTGAGNSEKIDASPMNFSATGSDSGSIDGLQDRKSVV